MNCQYSGRQDTVGDILIDNLKSDVFKNGFLKAFCNTIKIVEHTARFLFKRSRNGTAFCPIFCVPHPFPL